MAKARRTRKKLGAAKFTSGNVYAQTLKLTKGRGGGKCCNRKSALRAVKRGASPANAVAQYCPASCKVR